MRAFIFLAVAALSLAVPADAEGVVFQSADDVVFFEDFETGWGNWWADNGLWEVGTPTVGPTDCHSGVTCAGTALDGNYPIYANTRLISPHINLPGVSPGEKLRLQFWHWFRLYEHTFYGNDYGQIQVSVGGGAWETVSSTFSGWSTVWTHVNVDLTEFAGSSIQIAFYMASGDRYEDNGWYIDDVSVVRGPVTFSNPEDFEAGTGNWSADNGLWEVGTPTVGPDGCHSGVSCAGTVLDGNYPVYADTRLISPEIKLSSDPKDTPGLYFWQWFRLYEHTFYGNDWGKVQVSVDGGVWETVSSTFSGYSTVWSQVYVDLSAYAGSTIRIAFFMASGDRYEDNGWYIDDVRIQGREPQDPPLPDVKANGQDGVLTVSVGDPVAVTISLDPGILVGQGADWWIVVDTPVGWYYYNLPPAWKPGVVSTHQGPLFSLAAREVFNMSILPEGISTFYFAVDMTPNGIVDFDLYLDSVEVHVVPSG